MKSLLISGLTLLFSISMLRAQGTTFTYQGSLLEGGAATTGVHDFEFRLFVGSSGGTLIGAASIHNDVGVTNGMFSVALDFGLAFDGNDRWLEIAVRPGTSTGSYTTLLPRQRVTATPYAIRAANFSGPVAAVQLPANIARLDSGQSFSGAVQLTNQANVLAGNGSGISNLNLAALGPAGTVQFTNAGRFEQQLHVTAGQFFGFGEGDVSMADVNYDGLPDFLLARGTNLPVAMENRQGAQAFRPQPIYDLGTVVPRDFRGLLGADLNGDGRTDLVAYDKSARRVLTYLAGASFPSYTQLSSLSIAADLTDTTLGGTVMALADVNGNNSPDVIIANSSSNVVHVITNQGGTLFAAGTVTVGQGPRNVALGDINGDGKPDLVTANGAGNSITVATNSGGGRFTVMTQLTCTNAAALALADFNNDGRLDIAAGSGDSFGSINAWTNSVTGQFVSSWVLPGWSYFTLSFAAADFNGDGATDLLANQIFNPSIGNRGPVILSGSRNGRFGTPVNLVENGNQNSTRVFAPDLDQNGKADASVAQTQYGDIFAWLNQAAVDWQGITTFDDEVSIGRRLLVDGDTFLSGSTYISSILGGLRVSGGISMDASPLRFDMSAGAKFGQDLYNGFGIAIGLQSSTNSFYPGTLYFRSAPDFLDGAFAWYIGGYWQDNRPAFDSSSGIIGMTLNTNGLNIPLKLQVGGAAEFAGSATFRRPTVFASNVTFSAGTTTFAASNVFIGARFQHSATFESNVTFSAGTTTFAGSSVFTGNTVVEPPAALSFGFVPRQMLNLWGTAYGLGVQPGISYSRTGTGPDDGFAWYQGGTHSETALDAGPGGTRLMSLNRNALVISPASVGIGTSNPQAPLHVYSPNPLATIRLQSAGQPGAGRIEFLSDPQGSGTEWRPGYIQSTDNGGFAGGLSFVVNGAGFENRFSEVETMRIVNGRVGIGTTTPSTLLQVGSATCNGTTWINASDRNSKQNFSPVNPREVLEKVAALPVSRWSYKQDADIAHLGPMAQDFHAAFGIGPDNKHIATVDADGVALAAIQGLNQKLDEASASYAREMAARDAHIRSLEQKLLALEDLISKAGLKN